MARLRALAAMVACASGLLCRPQLGSRRRGVAVRSSETMDALIEELAWTAPFDLPGKVSQESVMRTVGRPQFFLRIAELCDQTSDRKRRERYRALADNLSNTLSAVVERTSAKLDDASQRLADVIASAAEEDGEFLVPLSAEKSAALKAAVAAADVDEAVLSTVNAATKKAQADGMDGLVAILRKVLQFYAAAALAFDPDTATQELAFLTDGASEEDRPTEVHPDYVQAIDCYRSLMENDADDWDALLRAALNNNDPPAVNKRNLLAIVQAQIERVVLLQENGSFKQRVQAEFLRELIARIEANAPPEAPDSPDDLVQAFLDEYDPCLRPNPADLV
eukprot:CAMPEP_0197389334 /NCGR_PEP_ID=MMETSP1165-20131217/1637_1 /TAXON_ID=284809 /ORGANISM="Chrysocystis fragilis, Strain CCMP3189" /LENGTH=335 /DNA_ID=CAMNT_0042914741 /DNA_START=11 /DNA_END=1016 /DNA_ORIENTATION=-